MKVWRILTLTLVVVSIGGPLLAGFTTWLSPAARAGMLALVPPVAAALLLVLYFNWRATLRAGILADASRDGEVERAA